jgi:23S rRNA (pseudouridine1915-N3)-methyltransferase
MKIELLFLGKTREKFIESGIVKYTKRLKRYTSVELVVLKEKINPSLTGKKQKENDAGLLLDKGADSSIMVALDSSGRQIDSIGLAEMIADWEMRGIKSVSFLIGGHLGLASTVIKKANYVLSLSRLTFTHEMSRLILLEQLYRAY